MCCTIICIYIDHTFFKTPNGSMSQLYNTFDFVQFLLTKSIEYHTLTICSLYIHFIYLLYDHNIFTVCSLYVHHMITISLLYVYYVHVSKIPNKPIQSVPKSVSVLNLNKIIQKMLNLEIQFRYF